MQTNTEFKEELHQLVRKYTDSDVDPEEMLNALEFETEFVRVELNYDDK